MTYKITKNDLYKVLDMINRQAGFELNDSLYNVKGAYELCVMPNGVKLVQYTGNTGERDVLPRAPLKQCFDLLHAFYAGMTAQV